MRKKRTESATASPLSPSLMNYLRDGEDDGGLEIFIIQRDVDTLRAALAQAKASRPREKFEWATKEIARLSSQGVRR